MQRHEGLFQLLKGRSSFRFLADRAKDRCPARDSHARKGRLAANARFSGASIDAKAVLKRPGIAVGVAVIADGAAALVNGLKENGA